MPGASEEQKKLMKDWEAQTGFQFIGKDRVRADAPLKFIAAWRSNVSWLENMANEVERLIRGYQRQHER